MLTNEFEMELMQHLRTDVDNMLDWLYSQPINDPENLFITLARIICDEKELYTVRLNAIDAFQAVGPQCADKVSLDAIIQISLRLARHALMLSNMKQDD